MKKVMYLLLFVIITFSSCSDDDTNPPTVTDEASLTTRLKEIFEESNFPGFSVGVVKDGVSKYQQSFGFQNIENNVDYTNQTIQPLASISKTFIAIATVKSIELGYFNLETPINDILPNPITNPKNPSAEIKIKHLINHTSGLIDEDETYLSTYYVYGGQSTTSAGAEILQEYGIVEHTPKTLSELINSYYYDGGDYYSLDNFEDYSPGEEEEYSNIASSLMAYLIEIKAGMPYQNFLKTHIFDVLEMNNTSMDYEISNEKNATLYFDKSTPIPFYGLESFPDGGIRTSNEDLMKYLLNMTAGQRGESSLLFSEEYYKLMFTATTPDYSIFWDIDPGEDAFGHNGGDPGVSTELHFSGKANGGFFLISNYDASTDNHFEHYIEIIEQINDVINEYLSN